MNSSQASVGHQTEFVQEAGTGRERAVHSPPIRPRPFSMVDGRADMKEAVRPCGS